MTRNSNHDPIPPFRGPGSVGPVIKILQRFLNDRADQLGTARIVVDGVHAGPSVDLLMLWQRAMRIDDDGGYGPQSHKCAKSRYGFDLDAEAQKPLSTTEDALTTFVQPNSILYWARGIGGPKTNLVLAQSIFHRTRHGN